MPRTMPTSVKAKKPSAGRSRKNVSNVSRCNTKGSAKPTPNKKTKPRDKSGAAQPDPFEFVPSDADVPTTPKRKKKLTVKRPPVFTEEPRKRTTVPRSLHLKLQQGKKSFKRDEHNWASFRGRMPILTPWIRYLIESSPNSVGCAPFVAGGIDAVHIYPDGVFADRGYLDSRLVNTEHNFQNRVAHRLKRSYSNGVEWYQSVWTPTRVPSRNQIRDVSTTPREGWHRMTMEVLDHSKDLYVVEPKPRSGEAAIEFDKLLHILRRCEEKGTFSWTVVPVTIRYERTNHMNVFVFNHDTRVLSRFEPLGLSAAKQPVNDFEKDIKRLARAQNIVPGLTYAPLEVTCPLMGPQSFASQQTMFPRRAYKVADRSVMPPGGMCAAWSLMFMHFRLNRDWRTTDREIVDWMVDDKNADEIALNIRHYASAIVDEVMPPTVT